MNATTLRQLAAVAVSAALLGACDMPTSLPTWDVTARVPIMTDSIVIGSLLPSQVGVVGGDFSLPRQDYSSSQSVGSICPACIPFNGMTGPFPAFTYGDTTAVDLPADLVSAQMSGGSIDLTFTHALSFDPLKGAGKVTLKLLSPTGTVVAGDSVLGTSTTWAPNTAIALHLDISRVTLVPGMALALTLSSPGSSTPVRIDTNARLSYAATATRLTASVLTANEAARSFATSTVDAGLDDDLRQKITDRATSATVSVAITYPFDLPTTMDVSIAPSVAELNSGSPAATGRITLNKGANTLTLTLGRDALQRIHDGSGLFLRYGANVAAGRLSLRPTDVVAYHVTVESVLELGGKN